MPNTTLQHIIEELKALTPDEKRELREILNEEAQSAESAEREKLIKGIRGKYANVLSSGEDFARRKAEEVELEGRR